MPHSSSFPDRAVWTMDDLEQLPDDGNRYEILHGELLVGSIAVTLHLHGARVERDGAGNQAISGACRTFTPNGKAITLLLNSRDHEALPLRGSRALDGAGRHAAAPGCHVCAHRDAPVIRLSEPGTTARRLH